jgi:PAS domain S-box-containing protein
MDHSPLLAWIKDGRLRFQYLNSAFENHRGVSCSKAVGKTYLELSPGKIAEKTHEIDNQVLYSQEPIEHIEEHINASGQKRKWLVHRFPIPGPEGAQWVAGTATDLTEHVRLQHESKITSFGLEHAAIALFMVDAEANILRVNEAATHHSGYSRKELYKMKVHDLNPDLQKEGWVKFWQSLKDKRFIRLESHHKNKKGHIFAIETEANYFEYEGREYAFAFVRNIQRRVELNASQTRLRQELEARVEELKLQKKSALKLTHENRLTNFSIEHAIFAFYLVDENARILRVNQASSMQTGYSREELLKMSVYDLDPNFPAENWPEVWKDLKAQKVLYIESKHRRKNGEEFPIEVEANFVDFEGKEYNAAFVRDISKRRKLQDEQDRLQDKLQSTILELRQKSAAALALANENELTSFALDHAVTPFFLIDEKARILRMNDAAMEQTGYTREELIRMTIQDLCPSSTKESWDEWWQELKRDGFSVLNRNIFVKMVTSFP